MQVYIVWEAGRSCDIDILARAANYGCLSEGARDTYIVLRAELHR